MEISFLGLAAEERPAEKHLQFELQLGRSISNIDTDTDTNTNTNTNTNTYSTKQASATEPLAVSPCV